MVAVDGEAPRKLLPRHENPFDNLIYKLVVEPMTPILRQCMHWLRPNHITLVSIALSIACIYFFVRGDYVVSAACYLMSYIADCFDGYYARKYDMTTKFGDWLDHVSDWLLGVAIFMCILLKQSPFRFTKLTIYILLLILMTKHFKCQEELVHGNSDSINFATHSFSCPNPARTLLWTRWFGAGTFYAVTSLILISYVM